MVRNIAFLIVAALSITPFSAFAAEELSGFTRVISYDELIKLSPQKREQYLSGLKSMMIEIGYDQTTAENRQELDRLRVLLEAFAIDESHAVDLSRIVPTVGANGRVACSNGLQAIRVGSYPTNRNPRVYICQRGDLTDERCPSGFIPVMENDDLKYRCASRASFDNVYSSWRAEARRKSLKRVGSFFHFTFRRDHFVKDGPSFESLEAVARRDAATLPRRMCEAQQARERRGERIDLRIPNCPSVPAAPAPSAPTEVVRTSDRPRGTAGGPPPAAVRDRVAVAPVRRAASPTPGRDASAAVPPRATREGLAGGRRSAAAPPRTTTVAPAATSRDPGASAQVAPPDSRQAGTSGSDTEPPRQPSADQPAPESATPDRPSTNQGGDGDEATPDVPDEVAECAPDAILPATCTASSIEQARRRYAGDANPNCIYAGNIAGYGNQKQAFGCAPPNKFCFGSPNCSSGVGAPMEATFSCGANEVICNPLLFGVKRDGETPFCISRQRNATLTCDEESNRGDRAVHPFEATAQNPTGWKKSDGVREAWDEFAGRLYEMCHRGEVSKAVHCRECHVIRRRLFALNVASRTVRNCGAALRFQQSRCDANGVCTALESPSGQSSPGGAVSQKEKASDRTPANEERKKDQ